MFARLPKAHVVVNYSGSKDAAECVVNEIVKNGGRAIAVQGSVSNAADVRRLFAETKSAFGAIDILVNNAGIGEFAPVEAVTEEQYRRLFDTNVLGAMLTIQEALKYFGPNGGSIINISSVASVSPTPGSGVYHKGRGEHSDYCTGDGIVGSEDSSERHRARSCGYRGYARSWADRQ